MDEKRDEIRSSIEGHVARVNIDEPKIDGALLAKILEEIELSKEKFGRFQAMDASLSDYISHLKTDVVSVRRMRYFVLPLSIGFVLFLIGQLVYITFFHDSTFSALGSYGSGALIVSSLAACVVVLAIMLRAVFGGVLPKDADSLMPEQVKLIVTEVTKFRQG